MARPVLLLLVMTALADHLAGKGSRFMTQKAYPRGKDLPGHADWMQRAYVPCCRSALLQMAAIEYPEGVLGLY